MLVAAHVLDADPFQVIDRGAEPHRVGDAARAGLEPRGSGLIFRLLEGDVLDHVAAALPGRHGVEHLLLAVQRADARGSEDLVARENVPVAVERLHVGAHVRHRLGAIDQNMRPIPARHLDHLAGGRDGAERVRDLRKRHQPGARPEQLLVGVEQHLAVGRRPERRAGERPSPSTIAARARCWRDARAR